jgi:CxxC motif-containing protein (DUF1111 family)
MTRNGHVQSTPNSASMAARKVAGMVATVGLAVWSGACGAPEDDLVSTSDNAVLGDHLGGVSAATFTEARDNFAQFESMDDGVGPVFNERSCGACHTDGTLGGAGVQIERRYGRFVNGGFDPIAGSGGSLRQLFTVGNFNNPAFHGGPAGNPTLCSVPVEVEPATATIHNVGRLVTPLFGLGLVDAMPDSFFDALAAAQPAATRGTARRVRVLLPNVNPNTNLPVQAVGSTRVARFGWKSAVSTLQQFAADAYVNEMGITTQSCIQGRSIVDFATESAPNGQAEPVGCDDAAPLQLAADVAATGMQPDTDDAVGSCAGGLTAVQDDIHNFFIFMTFLAPPPVDTSDAVAVSAGRTVFGNTGCASCHADGTMATGALATASTFRTPATTDNGVPGNFAFHPFSDFLIHDMGALGDQIGINPGETVAQTRQMRTAPLWGLRFRNKLLHDGRASDVATAVRAHDGQAAAARDAFNRLSSADQHNLVQFVRSL